MYLIIALVLALVAVVVADVVARRTHAAWTAAQRASHEAGMAALTRACARQVAEADAELAVAKERMAQRVFALRNHKLGRAAWAHHNINTRARVDGWVRPRVTKQSAAIRAAVGGRSAESLWLVLAECQAVTRLANRTGRAIDSGLHARINRRAERHAWHAANSAAHAARMAAMDAKMAADDVLWDARLAGMASTLAAHGIVGR